MDHRFFDQTIRRIGEIRRRLVMCAVLLLVHPCVFAAATAEPTVEELNVAFQRLVGLETNKDFAWGMIAESMRILDIQACIPEASSPHRYACLVTVSLPRRSPPSSINGFHLVLSVQRDGEHWQIQDTGTEPVRLSPPSPAEAEALMRRSLHHHFESDRRHGGTAPEDFELHIREVSDCRIDNITDHIIAGIITCRFSDAAITVRGSVYMHMDQGTFKLVDGHWAPNIRLSEPASAENE